MVDIKTTRSFRIEDGNNIAIKTDIYKNGVGKNMVRTLEEHNITMEEIEIVIEKAAPEELKKIEDEITKLEKEIDEIKTEHNADFASAEYKSFIEYIKDEKYKKMGLIIAKEKALKTGESRLKELNKNRDDVILWELQFSDMKMGVHAVVAKSNKDENAECAGEDCLGCDYCEDCGAEAKESDTNDDVIKVE